MKYYMSLDKDGCAYMTLRKKLFPLSLPSLNSDDMWIPGEWAPEVEGRLGFTEYQFWMNGYTVLTAEQVLTHLDDRLFEVEIAGEIINHKGEYHVCRKCRLIREVTAWNAETARLFALACARHVEKTIDRFAKMKCQTNCNTRPLYMLLLKTHFGEPVLQHLTQGVLHKVFGKWVGSLKGKGKNYRGESKNDNGRLEPCGKCLKRRCRGWTLNK